MTLICSPLRLGETSCPDACENPQANSIPTPGNFTSQNASHPKANLILGLLTPRWELPKGWSLLPSVRFRRRGGDTKSLMDFIPTRPRYFQTHYSAFLQNTSSETQQKRLQGRGLEHAHSDSLLQVHRQVHSRSARVQATGNALGTCATLRPFLLSKPLSTFHWHRFASH